MEDLRIGSAEGDEATSFGQVRGLAVDARDRIYVLDYQSQDVRVFDRDGRHVRTIGRKGEGPGEFSGAYALALDADQRLWVLDRRAGRYSVFDSAGAFVASYPRTVQFQWVGPLWGITPSGELLDSWAVRDPIGDLSGPQQMGVFRLRPDTEARDSLVLPPFERPNYEFITRRGSTTSRFLMPVPFAPEELLAFDARGFVWRAPSGTYEVAQLSLEGDTVRLVRREYQTMPVTDEDRERALESLRDFAQGADQEPDAGRVPATRPALIGMLVDDRGHLWVAPVGSSDGPGLILDVFDPDGRYLGRVPTLMRSWRTAPTALVRGPHLYYLTTDSLDVPYVVRARIVGRE